MRHKKSFLALPTEFPSEVLTQAYTLKRFLFEIVNQIFPCTIVYSEIHDVV